MTPGPFAVASPVPFIINAWIDLDLLYGQSSVSFLVSNESAIDQQLYNVLSTLIGDADWEPTFGSAFPLRLFDQMKGIVSVISTDLDVAFDRWMSQRVVCDLSSVVEDGTGRGVFVSLDYQMKTTGQRYGTALAYAPYGVSL